MRTGTLSSWPGICYTRTALNTSLAQIWLHECQWHAEALDQTSDLTCFEQLEPDVEPGHELSSDHAQIMLIMLRLLVQGSMAQKLVLRLCISEMYHAHEAYRLHMHAVT